MSFLSQNLPVNILEPRKQHEPAGNCSEIADFSSEYYISFISGVAKTKVGGGIVIFIQLLVISPSKFDAVCSGVAKLRQKTLKYFFGLNFVTLLVQL